MTEPDDQRLPPTVRELLQEQRTHLQQQRDALRREQQALQDSLTQTIAPLAHYDGLLRDLDAALADPTNTAALDVIPADGKLP